MVWESIPHTGTQGPLGLERHVGLSVKELVEIMKDFNVVL